MIRIGLLAMATALLSGCCSDEMGLTIENRGGEAVTVAIEYDHPLIGPAFHEFDIEAGHDWWNTYEEDTGWVDVEVRRASDGLLLYEEVLDPWDFEVHHGRIRVTVYP